MNTSIKIIVVCLLTIGMACDEIESPAYRDQEVQWISCDDAQTPPRTQKVILEEFTGFQCSTCPEATELAVNIRNADCSQVILIAVHAGSFAKPRGSKFSYEFRTPEGDELDETFQVTAASTPNALVNRQSFNDKTVLGKGDWSSAVAALLEREAPLDISIATSYDEESREVTANVQMEYYVDGLEDHYVTVYLLENEFVQWQKDRRVGDIEDYVHEHVLRTSFNGTWGDPVAEGGTPLAGQTYSTELTVALADDWTPEHLEVVAFVHRYQTTNEIVQAQSRLVFQKN